MPAVSAAVDFGRISINGKTYNIAPANDAYKVDEVPSHADVDQKMERRVIYRSFSGGIGKLREEPSMDATATSSPSFSFIRQNRIANGFYWASGCSTLIGDRIFCQRANTASNFASSTQQPFLIGDASVFSWSVAQNTIYALSTPPNTWVTSATTVPAITDAIQYGGFLYVAVGDANSFYTWDQVSTTTNWVQRANQAGHFTVIRNQLWRSVNANVYSTINTDPSSQVWTTATVVGDPSTNITALDVWGDFLMVFKQDGIYNIDKTGVVYPLFPGFKNLGMNPKPIGQWRDSYFFASDVGLVWEVAKGAVNRIGFDLAEPYPMGGDSSHAPAFSIPYVSTRGINLPNALIVGFNQFSATNSGGAYFLAWDGTGWHPYTYFQDSAVNGLGVTGGNQNPVNPVVQFSVSSRPIGVGNTNKIFYQTNPLIDPFLAASFDTNPQVMYLTADSGALEDEYKVLERVTAWVDNPSSGTLRIAYALDEEIASLTFHDMGAPQGDQVQSSQQFIPPQPFPTYRKILLRLTTTATASSACPITRYVILHYKQRVPQRRIWTIKILAESNTVAASGQIDVRTAKKIVNDLNLARKFHQQVPFTDANNDTFSVYIDQVGESLSVLKGNQNPSFIADLTLIESAEELVVNNQ